MKQINKEIEFLIIDVFSTLVGRHRQSFVTTDRHLLSAANQRRTTANASTTPRGSLKSLKCLSAQNTGYCATRN
jgi:hypothetical protein